MVNLHVSVILALLERCANVIFVHNFVAGMVCAKRNRAGKMEGRCDVSTDSTCMPMERAARSRRELSSAAFGRTVTRIGPMGLQCAQPGEIIQPSRLGEQAMSGQTVQPTDNSRHLLDWIVC